jgi:ribosomal protein S18 acetylase RimI-like enzyme
MAVYLYTYSTFMARPTLYVEDIFVWPRHRDQGAGQALPAALARIAVREGCRRMESTVHEWNTPAIRFYKRLGGGMRKQWILTSLSDAPLRRLAGLPRGPRRSAEYPAAPVPSRLSA